MMSRMRISTVKKLAMEGDVEAQHAFATAHAIGDGVEVDLEVARHWYEQAALQGDGVAAFNLATMLLAGEGGAKSRRKGMRWMREASFLGCSDASVWLGEWALNDGALDRASRYFALASVQGDNRGLRGLSDVLTYSGDPIAAEMSRQIRRELRRLGMKL